MFDGVHPIVVVAVAATLAMVATFVVQLRTRNAGYVDVTWSAMMALAALYYGVTADGGWLPRMLTASLAAIWGFRLALHLLHRVMREPEDGRYRHLREHWQGDQAKFFGFFLLQAAFVVVFSLPFYAAVRNPAVEWNAWLTLGVVIWIVSLMGETLADRQLAAFRSRPENAGKTCRAGLWRYTRHPNYFFEWLHWFAYVAFAVGSPSFALSLVGPVVMFVSLRWITGVPFVEQQSIRSRGDDYRRYQRETNAFFPGPPRSTA